MPSLKPAAIKARFTRSPKTGDPGFTMTIVARKNGVEINGDLVGPTQAIGYACAAEHFGACLAQLALQDVKNRATST